MSFALTLIASEKPLTPGHLAGIERYLDSQGIGFEPAPHWLARNKAADLHISQRPNPAQMATLRDALRQDKIDISIAPADGRRKKLFLADMDATIVTSETLDELAAHVGIGAEIAAITTRAMNGELEFKEALRERVGKLKNLPESVLRDVLEKTALSDGAEILLKVLNRHGVHCVLVSGGFTFFTSAIAARAGFDDHYGNLLEIRNGLLTGRVIDPVLDKNAKLNILQRKAVELKLSASDALAVGDGANDLPMLQAAGLGVGYRPKKVLRDSLDNQILYGDLTTLLYIQGFTETDIRAVLH